MSQPKVVHRYRYDPLDRLIETAGIQRFYNTTRMATEIQGAVQHSVFQSGEVLLAQTRREGAQVDCTLLATDFQRSVLHGVSPNKVEPIAYNVYGHRPAHSGLLSVLGFNGERPDPVTGHYLLGNGYRAFNPVLMRFNSPDSWSPFGKGGVNCYAYCGGDAVNRSDSNGRFFNFSKIADYLMGTDIYAGLISKMGARRKKVFDMRVLDAEIYQFEYTSRHGRTLGLDGHGYKPVRKNNNMLSGSKEISPQGLITLSEKQGTRIQDFDQINLLMCYGADAGFAQKIADLTGKRTKAYRGPVLSTPLSRQVDRWGLENLPMQEAHVDIFKNKGWEFMRPLDYEYNPTVFFPRKAADIRA